MVVITEENLAEPSPLIGEKMGWIQDLLKEVPLSAVLKERVALVEQKYDAAVREAEELRGRAAELEKEIDELRAQLPAPPAGLQEDRYQEHEHGLSEEELSIVKALFEHGELNENSIAIHTGLGDAKVNFWIPELMRKGIIYQTRTGRFNSFKIRSGQVGLLQQIGVME